MNKHKHKLKCEPDTTGQMYRAEGEYLIPKEPGEHLIRLKNILRARMLHMTTESMFCM